MRARPQSGRARPGPGGARGFTLIELVVSLALMGLLALLATPMAEMAVQREREQSLREALREIRGALDRYKTAADQGQIERRVGDSGYPPDLQALVRGVPDQKSPGRVPLYFLRRIPRDPFAPADVPAESSWGLRSYASAPQEPAPGADVFDVYSRSPGVGLNGQPYRAW
jgi:general secretion pathway protein G